MMPKLVWDKWKYGNTFHFYFVSEAPKLFFFMFKLILTIFLHRMNGFFPNMIKWFSFPENSLDPRKDTLRQKPKQSFQTKIMKSKIHYHQQNTYEMKAEFLTFQSTYDSLHTNIHDPRNINFKRRIKFDGTSVFSAIQTSVIA